ncbi:MAG: EscU/YscU/HrcU family type III secretion system export apparatus switch protein [Bdellovibrionales bacterium]|nr:EscU/YscU/HrcU family type III secretion system export apparatus switch protein [Bdellovibrionales bacterium]
MAEDQQERTEEATQQRREDFRKRGQVAQTRACKRFRFAWLSIDLLGLGRFCLQQVSELLMYCLGPELITAVKSQSYAPLMLFIAKKSSLCRLRSSGCCSYYRSSQRLSKSAFYTMKRFSSLTSKRSIRSTA